MSQRRRTLVVLAALLAAACDASFENAPRVTPARESLWILVGLQMDHDDLRSYLVAHPGKIRRSIPATALMRDGVNAGALASGAIATVRLASAGAGVLARVLGFVGKEGGGPAIITAGFAGGTGSVQVLAGGRALVLRAEEVIALANVGVISGTALAVYMAASDLHHICTDKNSTSDKQDGPWTPIFEEIFKKAGMTLQDPANLVRVKAHQGHIRGPTMKKCSRSFVGKRGG